MTSLITIYALLSFVCIGSLLIRLCNKWLPIRGASADKYGIVVSLYFALYMCLLVASLFAVREVANVWEAHVQPAIEAAQPVEAANPDTDNNHAN